MKEVFKNFKHLAFPAEPETRQVLAIKQRFWGPPYFYMLYSITFGDLYYLPRVNPEPLCPYNSCKIYI